MHNNVPDNQLIIPALGGFYASAAALSWPLIRFIAGFNLIPHGAQKLFGWFGGKGMEATVTGFSGMGFDPVWAYAVAILEFFGGIMLAIGLLTRPVALAVLIFMATACTVHWADGFFWSNGGFEYPLMWAVVALAIFFRGGGPLSVDRALGREF